MFYGNMHTYPATCDGASASFVLSDSTGGDEQYCVPHSLATENNIQTKLKLVAEITYFFVTQNHDFA